MGIATKKIYHLTGLSTDTKQIPDDISTGSTFLETDTGKTFVYNKSMNAWMLSKNVEVPQIDAPCRGILSIDLTSSAGLVDTYTIKYTNGSETTYEVVNGAFVEVNPDIKPMVKNKAYTLDINTIKYNLYKATTLTNCSIKHNIDTNTYDIISDVIDRNVFWPRKDEGFFVLKLRNKDDDFVFNFVGQNNDGQDIWQSFVVTENNDFKRYVGHFEYTDPTNVKTSDYYFIAKEQTISFKDLKESIDLEIARAKEEEERICEILSDVDTKLAEEIARAIAADEQLQDAVKIEIDRAEEAESTLDAKIKIINYKIPEDTTTTNKLVNRSILNDAISRSAATFLGEIDITRLVLDGENLDNTANTRQVERALTENEMQIATLDNKNNNDYVNIGYLDDIPEIGYTKFERYKYVEKEILNPDTGNFEIVSGWEFEYEISHTTFTQGQWDAIKSGITKEYVDRIAETIMVEDIITASDFDSTNIDNRNDHYTATSYLEARLSDYNSNIKNYIADYTETNLTITVDDWSDINNALAAALDSANGFRY